mgnify:CR=1 FL=1
MLFRSSICDDVNNTVLGPLGMHKPIQPTVVPRCSSTYNGWEVTYGAYLGQIRFTCSDPLDVYNNPIGAGLGSGSGFNSSMKLLHNQSIIGFHVFYDMSSGIKGLSILYGDFNVTTDEYACNKNDKKAQRNGMYSFLYGVIAFSVPALMVIAVIMYFRRKRHKEKFKEIDKILPLS